VAGCAVTDNLLRENANLIDSLSSAVRHGGSALADAPVLLRRVLEHGAWREFVTQRGDHVRHSRFSDFVTTPPLKGLGVDITLVERIVGTDDPDLLVMLKQADSGRVGRPPKDETPSESEGIYGDSSAYLAQRLQQQHPEQYAAVKAGDHQRRSRARGHSSAPHLRTRRQSHLRRQVATKEHDRPGACRARRRAHQGRRTKMTERQAYTLAHSWPTRPR
jgi:hypothetical protein